MYTNQSRDVFTTMGLGFHVVKTTATLPATTTQNIFTIAGGRVLITVLVGEATLLFGATATNLKVTSVPTVGTAADIASNLAVANLELGTIFVVEGDGTALIGVSAGAAPALNALPFILPTGTVRIETSATDTGSTKWDCWYFPLDEGASVVSA